VSADEPIPLADLAAETAALRGEIDAAIARVLDAGQFILGEEVEAFERSLAAYLGVRHAVGVASGTDALVLALRALELGPSDEVITTPLSFVATASAILHAGAVPVFADIDPRTLLSTPEQVAERITPRTRAIVLVHLYGRPASPSAFVELCEAHGLALVEDTAQALGSEQAGRRVGSFGALGCLSFFPSKNLGALGDGGMVVTSDDALADYVRTLRSHGAARKYFNEVLGYNSRLDAVQAAVLRVKLARLDEALTERRGAAARYDRLLQGVDGVTLPPPLSPGEVHTHHQYTIQVERRDAVARHLAERGIATGVYYPVPLHRVPLFAVRSEPPPLPNAEHAAATVLSLPLWPTIHEAQQRRVVDALADAIRAGRGERPAH
jgi:dTDP-4-amino-4,6-dideoxygalactose transaminase